MKKSILFCLLLVTFAGATIATEPLPGRGNFLNRKQGTLSGNRIRTTFFNYGLIGRMTSSDFGVEWPINSGHDYEGDITPMVGAEITVQKVDSLVFHIEQGETTSVDTVYKDTTVYSVEVCDGPRGNNEYSPDGTTFWGFEPLPGFDNPDTNECAVSHKKYTWPPYWPDKLEDPVDPGWPGHWNGYFGKDQFNADQETYFVMDDGWDQEFAFYPDSTDLTRRGLGLQVKVRMMQWSHLLAQDCIFLIYDITNVSTNDYDKCVFGAIVGTIIGDDGDTEDDCADFDKEYDITYSYDYDNIGNTGWSPVGYAGVAFLESPGNPFDGIDNDGDGMDGPGPIITEDMFDPISYSQGEEVVLIDYKTYKRTIIAMPDTGVIISFQDTTFRVAPGQQVTETLHNAIDDNLNGLIDENLDVHLGSKYRNWITGEGFDNLLIDEARSDSIDNDGDWDPMTDDVGQDGAPATVDPGEGDGVPTAGEPHFDATDIDESDQIGLTSFYFFHPFSKVKLRDDKQLWQTMRPGYFNATAYNVDGDYVYGSGYFPLKAGQTQRFSVAIVLGEDEEQVVRNKNTVQIIYNQNYNFAKAPLLPTLHAVPGDGKVTLYWDDVAERSFDAISGYDFEGYKIYRSTSPGFEDAGTVTDVHGNFLMNERIAQFDLENDIKGYFPFGTYGSQFYLGDDTGLRHSYVDSNLQNGQRYFYAVTAYDHGDSLKQITPTETSKFAAMDASGRIHTASNVASVVPNAPAAGYVPPQTSKLNHEQGHATGDVYLGIIDPREIPDDATYNIVFKDSNFATQSYSWIRTDTTPPETLIKDHTEFGFYDEQEIHDGLRLRFNNNSFIEPIDSLTTWHSSDTNLLNFGWSRGLTPWHQTIAYPADYMIVFFDTIVDTSLAYRSLYGLRVFQPIPVNFKVKDVSNDTMIGFAFHDTTEINKVSPLDFIVLLQTIEPSDTAVSATWIIYFPEDDTTKSIPGSGDTLYISTTKPFSIKDIYAFSTKAQSIDDSLAAVSLDKMKVVPNPYVATASWEPRNPYTSGRGPRELHFNHLPANCTIRIYNVRGELVKTIEHDTPNYDDGSETWDMLTKDNLDIAYGVYVYVIDAPGIGKKTGKFAVIK